MSKITSIKVVTDNNYPPFSFLDSSGKQQGILVDEWKLWEEKTGVHVELTGMDWGEALKRMGNGEYDVIDTLFYTDQRAKIYDFTKPYVTIDVPIFYSNMITGINEPESLRGFQVAVKSGDAAIDVLQEKGFENLVEYPSYESIIQAARDQKVTVFAVDAPPAYYFLYKAGIQNQFNNTKPLYSGAFHRAVKKGNTEILDLVKWGFAQISQAEYSAINRKWYGATPVDTRYLKIAAIAVGILAILLLGLLGWNNALRSTVSRRTQEIHSVIKDLSESEKKFRQLTTNIPGAVYRFMNQPSGQAVLFLSDRIQEITGYPADDFILNRVKYYDLIHPDDALAAMEQLKLNISSRKPYVIQYRIITRWGEVRWVIDRGQAVSDDSGSSPWIDGVIFDTTDMMRISEALREREEQLRTTLESMDDLVFLFDKERRIIGFHQPLLVDKLYLLPENFIGKKMGELQMPSEVITSYERAIHELEKTGKATAFDYSLVMPDGMHWYSAKLSKRIDKEQEYTGATAVVRDITERKKVEAEIHKLNAELEKRVTERTSLLELSNRELQTFSYSISHDLRGPLRSLNSFSKILLDEYASKLDETGQDYLKRIRISSLRMEQLIEALSRLARITRSDLQIIPINLSVIVHELAATLQETAKERQVEWVIARDVTAVGDPALIRVVLDNLLANAWKFTSNQPAAKIEFGETIQEGEKIYFVKDNGVGLNMAQADRLFIAFQRLHSPDDFEGNGVGLAIAQRILHRHGGRIWVQSAEGTGATFYFTLPQK